MTAKICYVYLYVHFLGPKIMSIKFVRMIIVLIEHNSLVFFCHATLSAPYKNAIGLREEECNFHIIPHSLHGASNMIIS